MRRHGMCLAIVAVFLASAALADQLAADSRRRELEIPPSYPTFRTKTFGGLFEASEGGKWGYIQKAGSWAIKPQFDEIESFSEGAAAVRVGTLWGFVDKTGAYLIKPRFHHAFKFSEGLAMVAIRTPSGALRRFYIDKSGREIFQMPADIVPFPFSEGLACCVLTADGVAFIDRTGRYAIRARADMAYPFVDGRARAQVGDKWGYLDKSGRFVVEAQFSRALDFSEGLACVGTTQGSQFIDREGRRVFAGCSGSFSQGLAPLLVDSRYGYVDKSGQVVIAPRFREAVEFTEGLAAVVRSDDDTFSYIDRTGNIAVRPSSGFQWANAFPFIDGLARVDILTPRGLRRAYVDHKGRHVWQERE